MISNQQLIITLCVLVAAIVSFVWLSLRERRPRDSLKPSMLPTIPLLLCNGVVIILTIVHLVNMFGVRTGS